MECWILYDRSDLECNRFFAESLVRYGTDLGMDTRIVTTDSMSGTPDLVVSRMRDWHISAGLESRGAVVVNGSRVCRVCNDKLETYRTADRLGIPHLPVSLPGERPPAGPPWVVKSRSGHGGSQVLMVGDEEGLIEATSVMDDPLVQEVAPVLGRDMRAYILDGEVLACVMRSSDTDFRANFSLGGKASLCEPPDGCMDAIMRICRELEPAFVGVDFVFGGDGVYLNEIEDVVGTRMLYSLTDLDPARLLMECAHSKMSL